MYLCPKNSTYGLCFQTESFITPSDATVSAIESWLSLHGLSAHSMTPAGDWISLEMTVKQANKMLAANFSTFSHDASGSKVLRTMSYSVPTSVQSHIAFVHPTVVSVLFNCHYGRIFTVLCLSLVFRLCRHLQWLQPSIVPSSMRSTSAPQTLSMECRPTAPM